MTVSVPEPVPNFAHPAVLLRVVDGDTYECRLDFGKYGSLKLDPVVRLRIRHIDTWELKQPEGPAAKDFAEAQLRLARRITVVTYRPTYERQEADIWLDGVPLADLLRAAGYEKVLV